MPKVKISLTVSYVLIHEEIITISGRDASNMSQRWSRPHTLSGCREDHYFFWVKADISIKALLNRFSSISTSDVNLPDTERFREDQCASLDIHIDIMIHLRTQIYSWYVTDAASSAILELVKRFSTLGISSVHIWLKIRTQKAAFILNTICQRIFREY